MPDPLPLLQTLRARRRSLSISRSWAAEQLGIAPVTLGDHERGARQLSLAGLYRYAALLDLEPWLKPGGRIPVPYAVCGEPPDSIEGPARLPVMRQLRATRLVQDLPRANVAARMGVTERAVESWERGERALKLPRACQYAAVLDVRLGLREKPHTSEGASS